jgi:AraC-like DNA-binding protein
MTGQALSAEDVIRLNYGVTSVLGKGMYSQQETLSHLKNALNQRRKAGSETQKIVLKAIAYIHANYACQITRKDMAEHVGLSERHLTRCFNLELGLTPMTYLNRFRVKQAKQLLARGPRRISEIAEKVGFSSGGYFSRVFRDEVGISPRDYEHEKGSENLSQN